jgi:hypothetical protein
VLGGVQCATRVVRDPSRLRRQGRARAGPLVPRRGGGVSGTRRVLRGLRGTRARLGFALTPRARADGTWSSPATAETRSCEFEPTGSRVGGSPPTRPPGSVRIDGEEIRPRREIIPRRWCSEAASDGYVVGGSGSASRREGSGSPETEGQACSGSRAFPMSQASLARVTVVVTPPRQSACGGREFISVATRGWRRVTISSSGIHRRQRAERQRTPEGSPGIPKAFFTPDCAAL